MSESLASRVLEKANGDERLGAAGANRLNGDVGEQGEVRWGNARGHR